MVQETVLTVNDLVYPLFLENGNKIQTEIKSLPGNYRWSLDTLLPEIESCIKLGLKS
ncbi:MAG: porphobilinogen synthase, partial [Candidatus Pacebacteria bacterium]|nr:porphobilinogen synthase [Candidatus Paceibacterota bacterium]